LAQTTHSAGILRSFTAATAVSFALLLANILLINGFPDAESDARVGKRTLVVRLGPIPAAGLYLGLVLLAHGWLAVECLVADSRRRRRSGAWCRYPCRWRPQDCCGAMPARRSACAPALALTIAAANVHGLAMAAGLASRWRGDKARNVDFNFDSMNMTKRPWECEQNDA
jgi:1,4-dihydroxy-2-naphthoate octaprenyltransferase